jgi:nucleotidyltransferase/DNA polymerase involved in DNA repair
MISTANYVARKWGVRSAMPGFIGQALCRRGPEFGMPRTELMFVSPDFAKYERVAGIARAIFAQYDPHFRAYSADEAYIDLTRYLRCRVACGDHASARAMLADEALESGASRLAEAREAARRVEELEPELEALRAAGDDVIVEVEEDDDDDEPPPTREERIASLEAELARARSVVDDAADAYEELRGRGIDVSSGDMDLIAQHVKKRLGEISAAVDALPALDFVGNDKAGALAERVLDEMRSSVRDATGGLTLSGGLGPNFRLAKVAADQKKPDGQFRVGAGKAAVLAFLRDLPWRTASLKLVASMASEVSPAQVPQDRRHRPRPRDEARRRAECADVRRSHR